MKRMILIAILGTSIVTGKESLARTFTFHGAQCRPVAPNVSSWGTNSFGIYNTGASYLTVDCPLPISYSGTPVPTIVSAETVVYNRGTITDCHLYKLDYAGNSVLTDFSSANTPNGPQYLNYSYMPGQSVDGVWFARCSLAPANAGNYSYITSFAIQTSE